MLTNNNESPVQLDTHIVDGLEFPVDEMVIDTDSFDIFSSLDDLKVEEKTAPGKVEVNDTDEHEDEEFDTEDGEDEDAGEGEDEDFDFEDIDEDEDGEAEEDEADEDTDADESEEGSELDEDEVDYEGYEVTLPNGELIKLDEAVKGFKSAEALELERDAFNDEIATFKESSKGINKALDLAKLEADRVIEDYADFDWGALAKEDPAAYVENKEFLERYMARRKELVNEIEDRTTAKNNERIAELQTKARNCVAELQNSIPNWSEGVYQELVDYAVENGADREEMLQEVNPVTFKVLHKALQFEKGAKTVRAKVKKVVKSPTKVVKKTSAKPGNAKAPSKKAVIAKKAELGDFTNAFDFLED